MPRTPNFKARDFDFARAAEKLDPTGPLTTTNKQHIPAARPVGMRDMQYRVPLNPSYDGNTVELAIEQMQFSRKCDALPNQPQFPECAD